MPTFMIDFLIVLATLLVVGLMALMVKWTPFWGPRAKLEIGRSVW